MKTSVDGFYWIWHYIFAAANRELVAAGFLANPYAPSRRFKGCIPVVHCHLSRTTGALEPDK